MPVFTSSQQAQILTHVLDTLITNVKAGQKYHPIALFLEHQQIEDIEDFLAFLDEQILGIAYLDKNGNMSTLLASHANQLINLRTWLQYLHQGKRPGHRFGQLS